MKSIACVEIGAASNGRGLRPRHRDRLGGVPVLARVVARAARVSGISSVVVICPAAEEAAVRALVSPLGADVAVRDLPDLPQRTHLRRRRLWAAHAWRGGIGGGFFFDEEGDPRALLEAATRHEADAVLVCSAAAPLMDVDLAERVLRNLARTDRVIQASFAPAPPGLAPWALTRTMAAALAEAPATLGEAMESARRRSGAVLDFDLQGESLSLPSAVIACPQRFTWDSDHAVRFTAALWDLLGADAESANAEAWVRAVAAAPDRVRGDYPRDLELELTTESPVRCRACLQGCLADSGGGRMDRALAVRLLDQAAEHDDVRVTFGGTGDPLRHPELIDLVRHARAAGVHGIHVQTQAIDLDAGRARGILEAGPDVISVCLDALAAPRYAARKGVDRFDLVRANLEAFLDLRAGAGRRDPLLVIEMVRTRDNEEDLEPFYDHWSARADAAVIRDHDAFCGQRADESPIHLHPPARGVCRRLTTKLTVRWNGSVPLCDEDFRGLQPLGDAAKERLAALWSGPAVESVRRAHGEGRFRELPLCGACTVWHSL